MYLLLQLELDYFFFQLFPINRKRKGSFLQPWGNVFWSGPAESFSADVLLEPAAATEVSPVSAAFGVPKIPPATLKTRAKVSALQRGQNQF